MRLLTLWGVAAGERAFWPDLAGVDEALQPWASPNPSSAPFAAPPAERFETMQDARPFLFRSPSTGRRAVLCLNQKVSSVAWKLLLLRAHPALGIVNGTPISVPHRAPAEPDPAFRLALADRSVPRLLFVRNPYSRLLSGYLDKIVAKGGMCARRPARPLRHAARLDHRGRVRARLPAPWRRRARSHFRPRGYVRGSGFGPFVNAVIAAHGAGQLNVHYSPLSEHCLLPAGMRYDFALKIEQLDQWYAPVAHALGVSRAAESGWGARSAWREYGARLAPLPGAGDCFYHPPRVPCSAALRLVPRGDVAMPVPSAEPCNATRARAHTTGADRQLRAHYTPELARAVSEWAAADLRMFEYPAWDGALSAEAYMRALGAEPCLERRRLQLSLRRSVCPPPAWRPAAETDDREPRGTIVDSGGSSGREPSGGTLSRAEPDTVHARPTTPSLF